MSWCEYFATGLKTQDEICLINPSRLRSKKRTSRSKRAIVQRVNVVDFLSSFLTLRYYALTVDRYGNYLILLQKLVIENAASISVVKSVLMNIT